MTRGLVAAALALSAALTLASSSPLDCFTKAPASAASKNVCQGEYPIHYDMAAGQEEACAQKCLDDAACTDFVFGLSDGDRCRLSHTCRAPTNHDTDFDGYLRTANSSLPNCKPASPVGTTFGFDTPLFSDGMILQRDAATKVWGVGAKPGATVTVTVKPASAGSGGGGDRSLALSTAAATAGDDGAWTTTLTPVAAAASTTVTATDGAATATLRDVAFGDVLLCGGQSNMGFGPWSVAPLRSHVASPGRGDTAILSSSSSGVVWLPGNRCAVVGVARGVAK